MKIVYPNPDETLFGRPSPLRGINPGGHHQAMAYPVPNSDDPDLFDESKQLRGWNLLVYKCKQQPLVPIGMRLTWDEVDCRCCSDMFCITRCCSNGVQKEF